MKIQKLSENMSNLDKVVQNADINSVTEMPPTMSRAYIDSQEADKATKDIIKPAEEIIKEKPFLGAEKQPTPKEPEETKITLDESLFEESLRDEIYDFLDELGGYADYNQKIEDVSDEFGMSPDEAEGYVWDWSIREDPEWHDTADQEEEEDIPLDILKDYVDSIEVEEDEEIDESIQRSNSLLKESTEEDIYDKVYQCIQTVFDQAIENLEETLQHDVPEYDTNWYDDGDYDEYNKWEDAIADVIETTTNIYMKNYKDPASADWSDETDVEFDESLKQKKLKEDGRSQSLLRQFDDTDIDEEELDLWTQVYSSLINKPDEATWQTMHKKNTVILPKKMRYETINTDADGNIVVYGETEKDLDGGIKVAKYYNLDYDVNPTREVWAKKHPEQRFSLTIKIPEEKVTDIDKYFEG